MNKVWIVSEVKDIHGLSGSIKYDAKSCIVGVYNSEAEAHKYNVPGSTIVYEYDLNRTYFRYPEHPRN